MFQYSQMIKTLVIVCVFLLSVCNAGIDYAHTDTFFHTLP